MDELVWTINARNDTVESFAYYWGSSPRSMSPPRDFDAGSRFRSIFAGASFSGDVRRHLYLAFKEAIKNAVKHARASEIGVAARDATRWW